MTCPLPVLKANKALRGLAPGARLAVLATDPAAVKDFQAYAEDVGMAWFCLGVTGLLFRVGQLWATQGLMQGLAWGFKIITDPFHDVLLYWKSPFYLLRGAELSYEVIDRRPAPLRPARQVRCTSERGPVVPHG
eukprot:gene47755-58505_t